MKFSIIDFFKKFAAKKSWTENFIFCAVYVQTNSHILNKFLKGKIIVSVAMLTHLYCWFPTKLPENIRKPLVFWCVQGLENTSSDKWVNNLKILVLKILISKTLHILLAGVAFKRCSTERLFWKAYSKKTSRMDFLFS